MRQFTLLMFKERKTGTIDKLVLSDMTARDAKAAYDEYKAENWNCYLREETVILRGDLDAVIAQESRETES